MRQKTTCAAHIMKQCPGQHAAPGMPGLMGIGSSVKFPLLVHVADVNDIIMVNIAG
jgi:hypothetical protein